MTFVSDTQLELLEDLRRHVDESHPELAKNPPPPEKVREQIKKV